MKVTITFELRDDTPNLPECNTASESLHEALCVAIHEDSVDDSEARDWLSSHVTDIKVS